VCRRAGLVNWKREKSLVPAENQTLDYPVTIPTTLTRLFFGFIRPLSMSA
jgi:hypothetical protein